VRVAEALAATSPSTSRSRRSPPRVR
jgi:hypothetical protein